MTEHENGASANGSSTRHPHEPEVLPTLDDEGRCLVCLALYRAESEGFDAGWARATASPKWLLTGDLDTLEGMIADYVWNYGQHLPGVRPEGIAGTPVAVANMAMSVIRKNISRVGTISVPADDLERLRRVERHAKEVMGLLDQYGASIVGHLLDNDDNSGEYLRRALG